MKINTVHSPVQPLFRRQHSDAELSATLFECGRADQSGCDQFGISTARNNKNKNSNNNNLISNNNDSNLISNNNDNNLKLQSQQ